MSIAVLVFHNTNVTTFSCL